MARKNASALQAGPAVRMLPACLAGGPTAVESQINNEIREIVAEAYSAGFKAAIKAISDTRYGTVILYELEDDPGFRPPM